MTTNPELLSENAILALAKTCECQTSISDSVPARAGGLDDIDELSFRVIDANPCSGSRAPR
jgi:hypothetical protein